MGFHPPSKLFVQQPFDYSRESERRTEIQRREKQSSVNFGSKLCYWLVIALTGTPFLILRLYISQFSFSNVCQWITLCVCSYFIMASSLLYCLFIFHPPTFCFPLEIVYSFGLWGNFGESSGKERLKLARNLFPPVFLFFMVWFWNFFFFFWQIYVSF